MPRPALLATWSAFEDRTVTGLDIRYWPSSQPSRVFMHPAVPAEQTTTTIISGIVSRTLYKIQHRLRTSPQRLTVWSAPIEVESVDAPSTDVIVDLRRIADDVRGTLETLYRRHDDLVEDLLGFEVAVTEINAANLVESRRFQKEMGAFRAEFVHQVGLFADLTGSLAQFRNEVNTRFEGPGGVNSRLSALSSAMLAMDSETRMINGILATTSTLVTTAHSRIDGIDGQLGGFADAQAFNQLRTDVRREFGPDGRVTANASAIQGVRTRLDGPEGLSALGQSILSLETETSRTGRDLQSMATAMMNVVAVSNAGTANGLMRWEAVSGPSGVAARFQLTLKASAQGTTTRAAFAIDVKPGFSEMIFDAKRFVFIDGPSRALPVVFQNGVLMTAQLQVGDVNFRTMRSANGKWVQRGYGQFADLTLLD